MQLVVLSVLDFDFSIAVRPLRGASNRNTSGSAGGYLLSFFFILAMGYTSLAAHSDRLIAYPLPSYSLNYSPIEYLWKRTQQQATHHKYFKACLALTVSVDKALAYFATHPDTRFGLFGRYCEESGLELKQAAQLSKSKPEHL
jgi:hypothetical protein